MTVYSGALVGFDPKCGFGHWCCGDGTEQICGVSGMTITSVPLFLQTAMREAAISWLYKLE
jgi:hypothetical protein